MNEKFEKLKMQSKDGVADNIARLAELFPNAVTEVVEGGKTTRRIDFDVLRQELTDTVVEGPEERYQFTWPDKRRSMLAANAPINATLRPVRADSLGRDGKAGGFDSENLYIEGDNLEVLKLLQETYYKRVKMIYIDPPYNTGNDFVYEDDFAQSAADYKAASGQFDDEGNRLVKNVDSNGRFHTDWLNMIYPRLKIAKNLLADDGVIFISIDDNEVANLRKVCDEVFGGQNFVACLKILSNPRGRQSDRHFANAGEYVVVYAKADYKLEVLGDFPTKEQIASYNKGDEKGKYRDIGLRKRGSDSRREDSPTLFFPIYYNPNTKEISLTANSGSVEILPKLEDGSDGRWRWSPSKIIKDKSLLYCRLVNRNGGQEYDVFEKDYLTKDVRVKHKDFWIEKEINYDRSADELRELFADKVFDFAKPLYLIKKIINTVIGGRTDSLVLDFFSGSATTAHAVMQLNAEDGGKRKFIMVQLPEACDEKSEAFKAGYKNICEIGKERIRRASRKIREENATTLPQDFDGGFRVLRLDSSNMQDVYYKPADQKQGDLFAQVQNQKNGRTAEDLLFQVMLDLGVPLSAKIEETAIDGKKVFNVDDGFLVACFDDRATDATVTAIAKMLPQYAVLNDAALASDSVATNFEQIFATYSPNTKRRVI